MRLDLRCLFLPASVSTVEAAWQSYRQEPLTLTAGRKRRKAKRSGVLSVVPAEGGCYLVAATEKETMAPDVARLLGLRKKRLTERDLNSFYQQVVATAV